MKTFQPTSDLQDNFTDIPQDEFYTKLLEAEREAETTDQRYHSKEVLYTMQESIRGRK